MAFILSWILVRYLFLLWIKFIWLDRVYTKYTYSHTRTFIYWIFSIQKKTIIRCLFDYRFYSSFPALFPFNLMCTLYTKEDGTKETSLTQNINKRLIPWQCVGYFVFLINKYKLLCLSKTYKVQKATEWNWKEKFFQFWSSLVVWFSGKKALVFPSVKLL